uniref:NADH dehydrogenase subunit 5 n=1 Tax=Tricentrus fulgidus TaxID=3021818 RepID=UPI00237B853B|nr:NADH dehydrogenase subunit 5 [Tricentrus fulgidus]WBV77309.1 NADH dehydrogenase subunit 5 [Tricentrus fulgidus]
MFNKYMIWFFNLMFMSFMFFYFSLYFMFSGLCLFMEYNIICLNSLSFYYVLIFDFKSMVFVSVVLFISSMVILYSSFYMGYLSFSSSRFLYLVLLFILSMFLMILSPNLISILLGWDGLGLVSYCLVIYYSSLMSNLSGMITCLTNRLGDIGILICISWMFSFGSWNFIFFNFDLTGNIFFLMIMCCFTSSAQIPFSCWLPAAMSAPTPVSSLVHSSTLVTAGVYLLIRFFSNLVISNYLFVLMGLITMIFSSFCANYEFDLKKIIAFSTLSQLGLMIVSIFLGYLDYSFFHLLTHAMFKSLLFLCSGIYIYFYNDNQDIRFFGGCYSYLPLTSCCFNISNLALCGIPFLSGFYSKDLIIEVSFFTGFNFLFVLLFYFSLGLTCCYSFRLVYYLLLMNSNFYPINCLKDEFNFMGFSVVVMSFLSIFFGCGLNWLMNLDLNWMFFPLWISLLTFFIVFLGLWFGFEVNMFNYFKLMDYYVFNSSMWFMLGYSMFFSNILFNFFFSYYNVLFWGEFYLTLNTYFYLFKLSNFFQYYLNNTLSVFMVSYLLWFLFML